MFWFSLSLLIDDNEAQRFLYCLINLGLMLLSVLLKRRLFVVFGGIGVFAYLSYLSYRLFVDSIFFPFALTVLGLGIIYMGVLYQRHYPTLARFIESYIPLEWRNLLPKDR
jgi:CHASE2 domain-containing sensor protein